jgi:hypothetical protein
MSGRTRAAAASERYRTEMLAVADRLFSEFPQLPVFAVAEAMNEVRREAGEGMDPSPDTIYRLARSRLLEVTVS